VTTFGLRKRQDLGEVRLGEFRHSAAPQHNADGSITTTTTSQQMGPGDWRANEGKTKTTASS